MSPDRDHLARRGLIAVHDLRVGGHPPQACRGQQPRWGGGLRIRRRRHGYTFPPYSLRNSSVTIQRNTAYTRSAALRAVSTIPFASNAICRVLETSRSISHESSVIGGRRFGSTVMVAGSRPHRASNSPGSAGAENSVTTCLTSGPAHGATPST